MVIPRKSNCLPDSIVFYIYIHIVDKKYLMNEKISSHLREASTSYLD